MALDIRGSIKNTKINNNKYIFIDELLTNAIDSYLIRKDSDDKFIDGLKVEFIVEFFDIDLINNQFDLKVICTDNGAGFSDEQVKAFVTKDTSYKDDLSIDGIGRCKGSGRIQFMHFFSNITINSIFQSGNTLLERSLNIPTNAKEIIEESFKTETTDQEELLTTITLDAIKPKIYEKFYNRLDVKEEFSTESLKNHLIINFLQRFVSLQERLGDFLIKFTTKYKEEENTSTFTKEDLPNITQKKDINLHYLDPEGNKIGKSEQFSLSHYKLLKQQYKLKSNIIALCARSATVKNITPKYLRTKTIENNDINGFYHIVLIESEYLDEYVNVQRDSFDIPKKNQDDDTFLQSMISFEQIYEGIEEEVSKMITPPDWDKDEIVKNIRQKYGISSSMISETNIRIHYGHTEEGIVKRVLKTYQEDIIKSTSELFDIKEEISQVDPSSDDFRKKINEFTWKYTTSLKSIDMANLSQIVVRRTAMVEILHRAVNKILTVQTENEGRRYDEKIIHNIFFPMGKDNTTVKDHDIWLLNEEYQYYSYIASDMALSKIKWDDNSLLFESNIDDEINKILERTSADNSAKRPDIALFNEEGSAIIVEFKSPGENLDEHVGDLREYAQLLAAKSKGKLKKFYGYLLGTTANKLRIGGMTSFPTGKGWFTTEEIREPSTNELLGELYYEILYYPDIVEKANKRLDVYRERLGINFNENIYQENNK